MQGLFQKVNRLIHSSSLSADLNEVILLLSESIKKHSQQIQSLNILVQNSKSDTLTILGGKISLSQFPVLLQKFKPNSTHQIERLKTQISQMQIKFQSYHQFNKLFDKGSLKEYQMRSLEDMILGNQQYIKGAINQLIVGKADRIQLQRLYTLNDRFDIELTNISKGLIELARHPHANQSRSKTKAQLTEKIHTLQEKFNKSCECCNQRYLNTQEQIKLHNQSIERFQNSINNFHNTFMTELNSQKSSLQQKFMQSISTIEEQREQIEQNVQQKIMISLYGSRNDQSSQLHTIKQEIIELSEEIFNLKNQQLHFDQSQIVEVMNKYLEEINSTPRQIQASQSKMMKQQFLKLGRRIETETKQRKEGLAQQLRCLKKQLESKVSVRQIEKIVDKLVTIDQTKQIMSEAMRQFQSQGLGGIKDFIDDQTIINEAICSQNMIGRWYWQGKQLKNGNLIPWQKQVINTCPEMFVWEQNTYQIIIMKQGMYRIELGVFSEQKKKPSIQLILNGNAVMSAVNNSSYVIHHSSGRLKETNGKSGVGASGTTLIDFLSILSKTRVAISFVGQFGKGFLSLKKL